jgi:hypothetical protein
MPASSLKMALSRWTCGLLSRKKIKIETSFKLADSSFLSKTRALVFRIKKFQNFFKITAP